MAETLPEEMKGLKEHITLRILRPSTAYAHRGIVVQEPVHDERVEAEASEDYSPVAT